MAFYTRIKERLGSRLLWVCPTLERMCRKAVLSNVGLRPSFHGVTERQCNKNTHSAEISAPNWFIKGHVCTSCLLDSAH